MNSSIWTKFESNFVRQHINGMLAFWDKDLICRYANKAYFDWFGIEPGSLIDKMHIKELLGPLYNKNLPYIQHALEGKIQIFERQITQPSGLIKPTLATYSPDFDSNNQVTGFYAHVIDISRVDKDHQQIAGQSHQVEVTLTQEVIKTLQAHIYIGFPGIESLSRKYYVSESTLKRKFKENTNTTVFAYFRKLQMETAEKLFEINISKKEIANRLNFSKASNLLSVFNKYIIDKKDSSNSK